MTYTAVVLTGESQEALINRFADRLPDNYFLIAHHMTINMGKAEEDVIPLLGKYTTLTVNGFAMDKNVAAVRVIPWEVKSKNRVPHITLAVNENENAKPVMSNELTDWEDIEPFQLRGQILEVK